MRFATLSPNEQTVLNYLRDHKRFCTLEVIAKGVKELTVFQVKRCLIYLIKADVVKSGLDRAGTIGRPTNIYCFAKYYEELIANVQ